MERVRWECVRGYWDWGVGGWYGLDRVSLFYYPGAGGWGLVVGGLRCGYSC